MMTAEQVLKKMINLLGEYLDGLKEYGDREGEQFQYGEKVAYVECLEYIQLWENSEKFGLDFDIESKYPL